MERIYKPLSEKTREEVKEILESNDMDALITLPLSLGEYEPDWKFAQDTCMKLAQHEDERVRANAALGLAYVARTKGKLEKNLVKPVLLQLLNNCEEYQWRVIDAINDINLYMNWRIGKKAIKRIEK
ncbi:hypothetical protein [Breznakia pachnodae]|uniref:HEAT repeat domain-containing protein n=1 Tax=Breznakia pachnodae TaxID=265178 RepID=A0ABU0E2T8_9FIRM|nr:hypothetical protein [Breznakia pachnodae]MDQ0361013.1 hypothetical protein [Breznakia pachnodae]